MYTALGIIAVVFWSTTVAVSRSLTEQLGVITAGAYIYLIAGGVGTAYMLARGQLSTVRRMPPLYLFGCGATVVVYLALLYLAIGFAPTRRQVIGVTIVNYLWPGLTLILSVPLLKKHAGPLLVPGAVLAFAGGVLATLSGSDFSAAGFLRDLGSVRTPYLCALGAAICWGFYSNLSRRWAGSYSGNAIPLFLLATGVVLALLSPFFHEYQHWTTHTYFELGYMALLPALVAYVFWDASMRKGNLVLVASVAYLAPVLSTTVTSIYFGLRPGATLWIACALVVAGAVVCKLSVTDPAEQGLADGAAPQTAE